jgi:hypothetical protein
MEGQGNQLFFVAFGCVRIRYPGPGSPNDPIGISNVIAIEALAFPPA